MSIATMVTRALPEAMNVKDAISSRTNFGILGLATDLLVFYQFLCIVCNRSPMIPILHRLRKPLYTRILCGVQLVGACSLMTGYFVDVKLSNPFPQWETYGIITITRLAAQLVLWLIVIFVRDWTMSEEMILPRMRDDPDTVYMHPHLQLHSDVESTIPGLEPTRRRLDIIPKGWMNRRLRHDCGRVRWFPMSVAELLMHTFMLILGACLGVNMCYTETLLGLSLSAPALLAVRIITASAPLFCHVVVMGAFYYAYGGTTRKTMMPVWILFGLFVAAWFAFDLALALHSGPRAFKVLDDSQWIYFSWQRMAMIAW
jgi:hypothetical protein